MKILFDSPTVRVFQSALFQTNATVVTTDDLVLVVDPNWLPDEIAEIRRFALEKAAATKPIYLLFTHSDYDHIIGYGAFRDIAAGVIASEAFDESLEKALKLQQIHVFDDEYYIERSYPIEYPSVSDIIRHDGQKWTLGKTELTFFHADGHNADGIFTIVNGRIWLAGDYLCGVEFPYIYHSSTAYEATLAKIEPILQQFDIQLFVNGHGDIATDHAEIFRRKKDAHEYIEALRTGIREGLRFEFDRYIAAKGYKFPRIMQRFHEGNLNLIRQEIFQ